MGIYGYVTVSSLAGELNAPCSENVVQHAGLKIKTLNPKNYLKTSV